MGFRCTKTRMRLSLILILLGLRTETGPAPHIPQVGPRTLRSAGGVQ
jgi:hypothetical protein